MQDGLRAGAVGGTERTASASSSRWTRGRRGRPGVTVRGSLTSCCSVLAAMDVDGDTSGFGACVSCSLAELVCGKKAKKL